MSDELRDVICPLCCGSGHIDDVHAAQSNWRRRAEAAEAENALHSDRIADLQKQAARLTIEYDAALVRAQAAESALIEAREALRLALWEPVAFVTKAKGALSLREMEQATGIDHNTVGRFLQGEIVNSFSLMPLLRWAALATEAWRTTDYNPEMVKEILTAKDTTPVKAPEGVKDFMRWLDEESPEGPTQAERRPLTNEDDG